MSILSRILPAIVSIVTLAGFELLFFRPRSLLFVAPVLAAIELGATYLLTGRRWTEPPFRWFASLTTLFFGSAITFALFIEEAVFQHLFALAVALAVWLLLRNLAIFTFSPSRYQPYALENLSMNLGLATVFVGVVSLFDLQLFFGTPVFFLVPLLVTIVVGVFGVTFWVAGFLPAGRTYLLVSSLVTLEVAAAVAFLPVNPLVKGTVVAVSSYLCIETSRAVLRRESLREELTRPVLLASFLLLVVLLTARWT